MSNLKTLAPAWEPGQSGNPAGRPVGNRNKLNEKFILALYEDFSQFGVAVIEEVRVSRPEIYLKVIASILPRQMHVRSESLFEGMSNGDVERLLTEVRRTLVTRAGTSDGEGSSAPGGGHKPH
jgi:hypothetical protein